MFTYIKQRQNTDTGNKRYDIHLTNLDGGNAFNPSTKDSYDNNDKILKVVYVNNDTKNKVDKKTKKEIFDDSNKETYYFGPFDKYYDYHYKNEKIANDLSVNGGLLDKTISDNGKDLCIIGYGQSGSGKTSTLIYSNYKDNNGKEVVQDGVLIEFCKNSQFIEKYKKIGLRAINLYLKETDDSIKSKDDMRIENNKYVYEDLTSDGSYLFKYVTNPNTRSGVWKRQGYAQSGGNVQNTTNNMGLENIDNEDDDEDVTDNIQCTRKQKFVVKDETIGEYILNIFQKREIEPTPNNPDSSRSHLIICLDLYKENEETPSRRITVCDLAGVENEFDCDDTTEIVKFIRNYGKSEKYSCEDMDGCKLSPENIHKYIRSINTEESIESNISHIDTQIKQYEEEGTNTVNNNDILNYNSFVTSFIQPLKTRNEKDVYRIFDILTYMYYHYMDINNKQKKNDTFYFTNNKQPSLLNINNKQIYSDFNIPDQLTKDVKEIKADIVDSVKKIVNEDKVKEIRLFFDENSKQMKRQTTAYRLINDIKKLFVVLPNLDDLQKAKTDALNELRCTLMLLNKVKSNCVIRRREGYMINRSLSDLRDGIQGFIKQSIQDSEGNMPLFYEKAIYPYCRNININDNYFDYFYNKPDTNEMTSALIYMMSDKNQVIPNSNVKPFGLDLRNTNFAIFTVINTNNDGNTNNPPNPPYVNINDLIYYTDVVKEEGTSMSKLYKSCYIETLHKALGYTFYQNGPLRGFAVLDMENKEEIYDIPLNTIQDRSRDLIKIIKSNNASTLIGSLESTDVLQNTVYNKMVCAETDSLFRNGMLTMFNK